LSSYESVGVASNIKREFLSALNGNREVFGSNQEAFLQQNLKPTTDSWLKEYQSSLQYSSGVKVEPGVFDIVKFIDANKYVKLLTAEEKSFLKELLDFYNWLLSPVVLVQNFTEEAAAEAPYVVKEKFVMPEEVRSVEKPQPEVKRQPPAVPTAPKKPVEEKIVKEAVNPLVQPLKSVIRPKIEADQTPHSIEELQAAMPLRPINIQDILSKKKTLEHEGSGLKMGEDGSGPQVSASPPQPNKSPEVSNPKAVEGKSLDGFLKEKNVPLAKVSDKSAKPANVDINKKLEELKKKVNI
jgi:hypothetical protein